MIRIGVIGYGYWGPNLVRNFNETKGCTVAMVSDLRPERLEIVQSRYPAISVTTDYREILRSPDIDAVAISTPVSTHFPLAMEALENGKHAFVEKPLTTSSDEALRLIDAAEARRLTLMVDHTFVYTGAVRKMRELVTTGKLGEIYYYDSVRVNLGLFQHDVDVIWDLAVHDLSIMDYVLPGQPCAVSATGISHVPGRPENIAYLTAFFEDRVIAHIHVNWLSPVKVRRTLLGGSQKMIVYDDLEGAEKIKVYDRGITVANTEAVYKMLVGYRSGDMWAPQLDMTEALKLEALEFVRAIEQNTPPLTGGYSGLHVVRVLEAATESMRNRGRLVELDTPKVRKATA